MKIILKITLVLFAVIFIANCESKTDSSATESIPVDTLYLAEFEEIVSAESALLARPTELVNVDEKHFAVYDWKLSKVITFSISGEKVSEIGRKGAGPGEWKPNFGISNLNYSNYHFAVYNRSQLTIDFLDKSGNYLKSIEIPEYYRNSTKQLLPNNKLLISTNGRENALAAILDLNDNGEVIQTFGNLVVETQMRRNFENQRVAYSKGEIPDEPKNEAIAIKTKNGYALFLNILGELRLFDDSGELINKVEIPESVKEPIFEHVVWQNREEIPAGSVAILNYIQSVQATSDHIFLLTSDNDMSRENVQSFLLVYDYDLQLQRQFVLLDGEIESALDDFTVHSGHLLFIDSRNSRVLSLDLAHRI